MFRFRTLAIIVVIVAIFSLYPVITQASVDSCEKYSSSLTPPSGFAVPYNVYSSADLTIKVQCDNSANAVSITFGDNTSNSYILNKAYFWRSGAWQEISITPNSTTNGIWVVGSGHVNITLNSSEIGVNNHILAFICNKDSGGDWQCGCRDNTCADHYWQVQRFRIDPPSPCSDGTPANSCAGTAPWYCDSSSSLVENCGSCGCTGTWVCGPSSTFCCDGICDNNCSNSSCSIATDPDCGSSGCCGDGTCNVTENSSSCPADCPLCIDGTTQSCGSSVGECSEGTQTCASNAWGVCVGEVGPTAEACDGLDNDCDGILDNGCACINGTTQSCGLNIGECSEGTQTCVSGAWGTCVGGVGPATEICGNGLDEDCDGSDLSCGATINKKLLSKFDDKQIFLIADDNWQEVMSLVSLTTWTSQDSTEYTNCHHVYNGAPNVCAYPALIYHREGIDTYDADSILHFVDQYSANSITAVNNPPTELTGHINGKGITPDIISINDYLSYWEDYNDAVYVQNNYQLALIASSFASLKNAPLVVSGSSLDVAGTFNGKNIYTVGSVACPASASGCTNFANVAALEQEYLNQTNTDKLVLVNYNDLNLQLSSAFQPYYSSNNINNIYANQSLTASFLAGAKHELIISTNATSYLNVDNFIEQKQSSLAVYPKYLTVIAYPGAIQMSEYNMQPYTLDSSMYNEVDNSVYADTDHNDYPDMAVGRIFSISTSDVSSNIARSLYYDEIPRSNNFSMLWPNYFQSHKIQAKGNDALLTVAGLNQESIYYDGGYSSMNIARDIEDKFIINYLDHSTFNGYHDTVYSNSLLNGNIQMHPSIMVSDSCETCAYEKGSLYQKNQLFCSRVLRQGALAHLGGVEEIYIGRSDSFSKMFIESVLSGRTLGEAIKKIKTENVIMRNRPSNSWKNDLALVLMGDPTFSINSIYPSVDQTEIVENIPARTVELKIPEVSDIFSSDILWPSTKYNQQAYVPPFGEEVADYITTYDPATQGQPYMQAKYFIEIDNNYSISDIASIYLVKADNSEEAVTLYYHPNLSHSVYPNIYLNGILRVNSLNIRAEEDSINNKIYIYIQESYRFDQNTDFGNPVPAHSYRIQFN